MPVVTDEDGRDDNEGPHCRNCHLGANTCDVCHADDSNSFSAAYTAVITTQTAGKTNYSPQSYLRQSATAGTAIGEACLDGGFSYPHRTLGKDMLKDELFGIDFDGTAIAAGETRSTNGGPETPQDTNFSVNSSGGAFWVGEKQNATSIVPVVRTDSGTINGAAAENLDSVCIDCHGDASYWNGDDESFLKPEGETNMDNLGVYGSGQYGGWDLLLKGLP